MRAQVLVLRYRPGQLLTDAARGGGESGRTALDAANLVRDLAPQQSPTLDLQQPVQHLASDLRSEVVSSGPHQLEGQQGAHQSPSQLFEPAAALGQ